MGVGVHSGHVRDAEEAGDTDLLGRICSGKRLAKSDSVQQSACRALEQGDQRERTLAAECGALASEYEKTQGVDREYLGKAAARFVECGDFETLFEKVIHFGNEGEGKDVLLQLEDDGVDLNAAWAEYLSQHQGRKFFGSQEHEAKRRYGIAHVTVWLLERDHTEHCPAFAAATLDADAGTRASALPYLTETGCDEMFPVIVSLLQEEAPGARRLGCETLAKYGRPSELEALSILASTDGYSQVREVVRNGRVYAKDEWPVRDACRDAAGKIRLRAGS